MTGWSYSRCDSRPPLLPSSPTRAPRDPEAAGPIDIALIDADKEGYPDYLEKLASLVRPGGLIIADNMSRPAPDPRYVRAITTDPHFETVFLNMHATGLGVTLKKH